MQNNNKPLDIVFLSRISPQKNLLGAIHCLKYIRELVCFTIYGPLEDQEYWEKCNKELIALPNNINWKYEGTVPTEKVQDILQKHDIFLLPTLGENYGHVIFEALSVGCIPVISDQTPWNILTERRAGYVCPLTPEMEYFTKALQELYMMKESEIRIISDNGIDLAKEKAEQTKRETGYRIIFG